MKFWNWGPPTTVWHNIQCVAFFFFKITPPYCTALIIFYTYFILGTIFHNYLCFISVLPIWLSLYTDYVRSVSSWVRIRSDMDQKFRTNPDKVGSEYGWIRIRLDPNKVESSLGQHVQNGKERSAQPWLDVDNVGYGLGRTQIRLDQKKVGS